MTNLTVHTVESAPEGSKEALAKIEKSFGFLPNMYAVLGGSPATLEAYLGLQNALEKSSLSPVERQVVLIAVSVYQECEFCVPAHSFVAKNMVKADPAIIDALRDGNPLPNPKLNALAHFAVEAVKNRGQVSDAEIKAFFNAGFSKENLLDALTGIAMKTLSNFTSHIGPVPLNPEFASEAWTPASKKQVA